VEAEFRHQKGVIATRVGFSGGHTEHPSYHDVCGGDTGHAETVEVEFDPKVVSYEQLLDLFFDLHEPTLQMEAQYRSAVFVHSMAQRVAALAARDKVARELKAKVVTEISPAGPFWPAEEYHQQYVEKGGYAVCHRRKGNTI
jgi:peptide-methionine (S)-S-oxide reductase